MNSDNIKEGDDLSIVCQCDANGYKKCLIKLENYRVGEYDHVENEKLAKFVFSQFRLGAGKIFNIEYLGVADGC